MQFNIFLITAILGDLALATYDTKLYKSGGCSGTAGIKCLGLAAGKCCARRSADTKKGVPAPWSLSHSANNVETGSEKSNGNDQIKVYTEIGGKPCGLPADQSSTCASSSSKSISGAAVFVVEVVIPANNDLLCMLVPIRTLVGYVFVVLHLLSSGKEQSAISW